MGMVDNMPQNNNSGGIYIGVVEDRNDPQQMGRVRVRVLGVHSPDRINDVPINMLPWSMVMQPSNAMTGSSTSVAQLVEGTWVVVYFMDANYQECIVLGSISALTPDRERILYENGFNDPFGVYPLWSAPEPQDDDEDEENTNRQLSSGAATSLAAKEEFWQEHPTYNERGRSRVRNVPKARPYRVSSVGTDLDNEEDYETKFWEELDLRGGNPNQSIYPFNEVHEHENGTIVEYDASPRATRFTEMHASGSYREVLVDGTTTVKIVGDGYEIVLGEKSMFVKGDLNLTVEGDMRQLVKGDYTLEVGGTHHTMVAGNRQTKLLSNDLLEIGDSQSINITNNHILRCGEDQTIRVTGDRSESIGGNDRKDIGGNLDELISGKNTNVSSGGRVTVTNGFRNDITSQIHVIAGPVVRVNNETFFGGF